MSRKDEYEERREAQHAAEMERLRMQKAHYATEAEVKETLAVFLTAVRAFLSGQGSIHIANRIDGGTSIRFEMPPLSPSQHGGQG